MGPPLAERVHVLVHELRHIHRCGQAELARCRGRSRGSEAELAAFSACTIPGLHAGDVTDVYASGWTDGDPETITAAQAAIHQAARRGARRSGGPLRRRPTKTPPEEVT